MILIFEAFLASGIVYAGITTFKKQKQKEKPLWLSEHSTTTTNVSSPEADFIAHEKEVSRDFSIASVSIGMAITGSLFYPPLGLASIPLTIYGSLSLFEEAYVSLFYQGRAKLAIVSSIVVIGSLATNHYIIAALIQWGHHFNQKLILELDYTYRQFINQFFGPQARSIWVVVNDVEVKMPRDEIKIDDIVVVSEGDIIPIDGIITNGKALVDQYILTGQARPVEKKLGDRVFTATTILSGKIYIQVKKNLVNINDDNKDDA